MKFPDSDVNGQRAPRKVTARTALPLEERVEICKAIAAACMWGHGGIAGVILDDLDKRLPGNPTWRDLHAQNQKAAEREKVGVITDEAELRRWLSRGYWLTNWDEDGCMLFNPPPMNGLFKYVSKALAEAEKAETEQIEPFSRSLF